MKTLITSASVGLLILILSFSTGHAKIKLMGVGGHIGLVDPEGDIGSTIALGGNADLGEIIPNLKLTTDVEYWSAGIEYAGTPTWTLGGSKEESDSENKLEFHFVGGAEYPINPQLTGYAELRYDSGDCDIMGIYVGVNYALSSQK
jgi:opacity protein-like surface antigen